MHSIFTNTYFVQTKAIIMETWDFYKSSALLDHCQRIFSKKTQSQSRKSP